MSERSYLLSPPISDEEAKHSAEIRECIKNLDFDKLYEIIPREIALIICKKYRVINK